MFRSISVAIVALFVVAALPSVSSAQTGYTNDEIISLIRSLGTKLEAPADKLADLTRNFKRAAADDSFKAMINYRPIVGLVLFRAVEAGVVYKRRSGSGLALFKATGRTVEIQVSGSSLGASIGGSAEWSLGLLVDLKDPHDFGGTYAGREKVATAAGSTTTRAASLTNADYVESGKVHDLIVIVSGRGLSAGVSNAKITITPEW